ncbi:MAG: fibronectin type III domain-containing protein, partial [Candidatus Saganbacteria bacterium]|nr:fibronectin type III domain-containing protein [Candidatus Saganbacteria bacterium]
MGTATTTEALAKLSSLNPETQYYVKVRADRTGKTSSAYSAAVAFTTKAVAKPSNLVINAKGTTWLTGAWNAGEGAVKYNVQYRKTGDQNWTTVSTVDTFYTMQGLLPSTQYEVQVESVDVNNLVSGYTAPVSDTTGTIEKPINLSINAKGITWLTGAWDAAAGAVKYNVQIKKSADQNWVTTVTTADTFYTFKGLDPLTSYDVRVEAVDGNNGTSGYTLPATDTTLAVAKPKGLTISGANIGITWMTPTWEGAEGAASYNVQISKGGLVLTTVNTTDAFYTFKGLDPSTLYSVKVEAAAATGTSGYSDPASATTKAVAVPTNVDITNKGITYLVVGWNQAEGAVAYNLQWKKTADVNWTTVANADPDNNF